MGVPTGCPRIVPPRHNRLRYSGVYRHIQKSVTGLADAKLLKLMPKMRAFDDNVAEALSFFENPVIEASLNREIHF